MPIFGADHTEPEGSNFARQEEDFGTLRKAVKEIDSELKKNFKYYKGTSNTLHPITCSNCIGRQNSTFLSWAHPTFVFSLDFEPLLFLF
jgi:hypothetical protein